MKICRFKREEGGCRVGLLTDDGHVIDLTAAGVDGLESLLETAELASKLKSWSTRVELPRIPLAQATLLAPIEQQEVWAAGVTYLRSKKARMEESEFSASAYDLVYEAARPELFFKALPQKVAGPKESAGIRRDARWSVPEPELAFVISSTGNLIGHTIGNDMSSRDIEGENLLYLPQAKVYDRSCALGPCIRVGVSEEEVRSWTVRLWIERGGKTIFEGMTSIGQIKRRFTELVEYLMRSQTFPHGVILLTGTGVVPPDEFSLQNGDHVRIQIDGIGRLENDVVEV